MIKMFSKRTKNQKGFTLVELIVVIAIMGILAAIAVPRLSGYRETAQVQAAERTLDTIENAINIAIASGDLGAGTVTATPTDGTGLVAWSGDADSTGTDAGVQAEMEHLLGNEVILQRTGVVTWTIDGNGDVTVTP